MQFLATTDSDVRKKALDALDPYENKGISAINELILATVNNEVKMHGLDVIKRIRTKTNTKDRPWQLEGEFSSDED